MSDELDRAVDARIDAYRPKLTPPFTALQARKRGHDRRRIAGGAAVLAAGAAGTALLIPSLTAGGDRLVDGAAPSGAASAGGASARATCVPSDRFGTGPGPRYVQVTPPEPAASQWSLPPGGSVDLALPVNFLPGTEPGGAILFVLPYGQAPDSRTERGTDPRLIRTLTATSADTADGSRTYHFRIEHPESSPPLAAGRYSIGFLASGSPPLVCGNSLPGTAAALGILGTLTVTAP